MPFKVSGEELNYPEVATFANLPAVASSVGKIYIVTTATGTWPLNRKRAGLYRSDGATWTRLGIAPTVEEIGADPVGSAAIVQANLDAHESEEFNFTDVDTEYVSPNQHGNMYGVVYRTYFNTSLPSYLTTGDYVSKIVNYSICFDGTTGRFLARGLATHWAYGANKLVYISLSGLSGNGNLSLVDQGYTITDGWVDYIKAV